jgi:hypothetical protein
MLADDHGEGVHNHLCPYITIILRMDIGKLLKMESFGEDQATLGLDQQMIFIE